MTDTTDWVGQARARQQIIPAVPPRFAPDITPTLVTLEAAGLPATVEAYDLLRLPDGRRVQITTGIPPRSHSWNPDDGEPELVLAAGGTGHHPPAGSMPALATRIPELLFVDPYNDRVYLDGAQVHGDSSVPDAGSMDPYAVLAVARTVAVLGGDTTDIAHRTGLSIDDTGTALLALGDMVRFTSHGWEATSIGELIDFADACWPDSGGIRTTWTHPGTPDEQALALIDAGLLVSDTWAAHHAWHQTPPTPTVIAYAHGIPDLTAHGFELHTSVRTASTVVIVPEDQTLFATANTAGGGGTTDHVITAATILHEHGHRAEVADTLRWLTNFTAETTFDLRWNLPS